MGSRRYTAHVRLGPETGRRLVYVFGSNRRGAHGRGSASYARRHHGAKPGQGEGLAGHSYALPTKDADIRTLPLDAVQTHVGRFLAFAVAHPEMDFLVSRVGCGLAGYRNEQIAPMFDRSPDNVWLPGQWLSLLGYEDFPLVISGSRHASDPGVVVARLESARERLERNGRRLVIVEGGCRRTDAATGRQVGVDYFGFTWAKAHGIPVVAVEADWGRLGNGAGPVRNALMGQLGAGLLAYPAPDSRGTRNMISVASQEYLPTQVVELGRKE